LYFVVPAATSHNYKVLHRHRSWFGQMLAIPRTQI